VASRPGRRERQRPRSGSGAAAILGPISGQAAAAGMSSRYTVQGCADWFLMRHLGRMNSTHIPERATARDETGHDAKVPASLPAVLVVSDGTGRANRWTALADGRKIRQLRNHLGLSQDALAYLGPGRRYHPRRARTG
jgi:hypothetical protein